MTLKTGERRAGRFHGSSADDLTIEVGREGAVDEETILKSAIRRVATQDLVSDGIQIGSLSGAAALVAFVQLGSRACGRGCENDLPGAMPLIVGLFGGGMGAAVGFLADRFRDGSEVLYPSSGSVGRAAHDLPGHRFSSRRPSVSVGALYRQITAQSGIVHGTVPASGFAITGEIARHVSLHAEYTGAEGFFYPVEGAVPDAVLENIVPATSRSAGWSHGIASRRITFAFSELVGLHPAPFGRVRLELLAGLGVVGQEKRDYYSAYQISGVGPQQHVPLPGKYYVLDFESPELGLVYGIDAEIILVSGLTAVPTLRYYQMDDPASMFAYGVGVRWRF